MRVGPYPAFDRIIAENRYSILTELMRTVNNSLNQMPSEIVCRSLCQTVMNICRSGFSFEESDFRHRILTKNATNEVFGNFGK